MENGYQITLQQYFTYNNNLDEKNEIIRSLFSELENYHKHGYCVYPLNSNNIEMNSDGKFHFVYVNKGNNDLMQDNIKSLCKLSVGVFLSEASNFYDWSGMDDNYIKNNFDSFSYMIPDNDYFRQVLVDNKPIYYGDYLKGRSTSNTNANQITKIYSTPEGKAYAKEELEDAAFIKLLYYPVIIICILALVVAYLTFISR